MNHISSSPCECFRVLVCFYVGRLQGPEVQLPREGVITKLRFFRKLKDWTWTTLEACVKTARTCTALPLRIYFKKHLQILPSNIHMMIQRPNHEPRFSYRFYLSGIMQAGTRSDEHPWTALFFSHRSTPQGNWARDSVKDLNASCSLALRRRHEWD